MQKITVNLFLQSVIILFFSKNNMPMRAPCREFTTTTMYQRMGLFTKLAAKKSDHVTPVMTMS